MAAVLHIAAIQILALAVMVAVVTVVKVIVAGQPLELLIQAVVAVVMVLGTMAQTAAQAS